MTTKTKTKEPWELLAEQEVADLPAKRIESLPESLRRSRPLLGEIDSSLVENEEWDERNRRRAAAAEFVSGLSATDRGVLFRSLFPKLAPAMERAWREYGRVPIVSTDWDDSRKPFRASGSDAMVARPRGEWLVEVCGDLARHEAEPRWFATWLCHLAYGDHLPWLMAAVLDGGGPESDECLEILKACAAGQHPTGEPSESVLTAMLMCERPEAWTFVEKLLLAAKREEGLRQSILESVQFAHPEAFRRMLRIVLDENLVRFSSVVRAADVWFGLRWDSMSAKHVQDQIAIALGFLRNAKDRHAALSKGTDANAAYLALWAEAFENLSAAGKLAEQLLGHAKAEMRFVAVHLLAGTAMPVFAPLMVRALADTDLRVSARATDYFRNVEPKEIDRGAAFAALEALHARVGAVKGGGKLKEIVWPWTARKFGAHEVGGPLVALTDAGNAERLVPYIDKFGAHDRATIARYLGRIHEDEERSADLAEGRVVTVGGTTFNIAAVPVGGGGASAVVAKEGRGARGVGRTPISEGARRTLVSLLGDSSRDVRETAFEGLRGRPLGTDEVERLESLLDRKAADLRTSAIARLAEQDDDGAIGSAGRLIGAKNGERRRAGVELLGVLAKGGRCGETIRALVADLEAGKDGLKLDAKLRGHLEALKTTSEPNSTLAACLGLIDLSRVTPAPEVSERGYLSMTSAAIRLLRSLDHFIGTHKETPLPPREEGAAESTTLLGHAHSWDLRPSSGDTDDRTLRPIVLEDLWRKWNSERGPELRDPDGLELLRAALALETRISTSWDKPTRWPVGFKQLLGQDHSAELEYESQVKEVVRWLIAVERPKGWGSVLLDAMETSVARGDIQQGWDSDMDDEGKARDPRSPELAYPFEWYADRLVEIAGGAMCDEEHARLWRLYRAVDEWAARVWSPLRLEKLANKPKKAKPRWSYDPDEHEDVPAPQVGTIIAAMRTGAATEADFIYAALHVHPGQTWSSRGVGALTDPKELARLNPPTGLAGVVERIRDRIIELELRRGDATAETTRPAMDIERTGGMRVALSALERLGSLNLARKASTWEEDKAAVFSQFILKSEPGGAETPKAFERAAAEHTLGEDRLIQLAVYAPQWAGHVESALGWPGLVEAVWWIHAHTKDNEWRLDERLRQIRDAAIAERTPLTPEDLKDGAVDVMWFARVYTALGKQRWERVYEAAKYACGGIGHKRAQIFADAMLGRLAEKDLVAQVKDKRRQDSVRALGLLPLKAGKGGGKTQVLARFRVMQELRRTSRKHGGSMLQASEKRAVEIGMENLARTAGYPDPVRLQWAMEAEEVADLAKGPVRVKAGTGAAAVSVTLSIDGQGAPQIDVVKGGKALASIPPAVKKDAKVAALTERVRHIRQQASRMRQSLEGSMCRGDVFTGSELAELWKHPVLRPMLERLVFVGKNLAGYPDKGGKVLRSHDGTLEPLKGSDELRLAHPHDLLKGKAWPKWQRECFSAERVQPFKQVFRELYVLTERERKDAARSTRYAGHQVQPRQALALLGQRGWVNRPEQGVQRTFHAERLTAWVEFDEPFYTPAEVEGLTLEAVRFTSAGKGEAVKLADVPPRVFSEVMRDLDLVVSVAHRGGVDPEASESTVEARASLLRETCRLLKLTNVTVDGPRANIRGSLGDYSVHLGSATIQMLPGGAIWIVPVHAQHRGRLFLPFADNDPKTAEVISKVLLLARDSEIKDPGIRQQISQRR